MNSNDAAGDGTRFRIDPRPYVASNLISAAMWGAPVGVFLIIVAPETSVVRSALRFAHAAPGFAAAIAGCLVALIALLLYWRAKSYLVALGDSGIWVRKGRLARTSTFVRQNKIKHYSVVSEFADTPFGTASVLLYTEGSNTADLCIPHLSPDVQRNVTARLEAYLDD